MDLDEEIIKQLEELDKTLANSKRTFKQIQSKVELYKIQNNKIVNDLTPWFRFFGLGNDYNVKAVCEKDHKPFAEFEIEKEKPLCPFSSVLTENDNIAIFNQNQTTVIHEDGKFNEEKFNSEKDSKALANIKAFDSDSSSLIDFDMDLLPDVFRSEKIIIDIYNFIKDTENCNINDLYTRFNEFEKIKLCLKVLKNKKFIKFKNEIIYVKK
ncbi:hypothetical protein COBT_003180 [Conglomerata obtusa]